MIKILDGDGQEIKYQKVSFPDSQQSAELLEVPKKPNYIVCARLASFMDVELMLAVVGAIKAATPSCKVTLNIVYLLGGRSDRQFSRYSPNYLRDVIAPIINQLNLTAVRVLDPHSDVTEAVLKKSRPYTVLPTLLQRYLADKMPKGAVQVVVPDAGAEKRILHTISSFKKSFPGSDDVEFKLIQCLKTRDLSTGAITGLTLCQNSKVDFELPTIVMDDLCDGGKTFLEIANLVIVRDLDLIVTHGVFSKGVNPLLAEYNCIYTTNSFQEFPENQIDVDVFKVI